MAVGLGDTFQYVFRGVSMDTKDKFVLWITDGGIRPNISKKGDMKVAVYDKEPYEVAKILSDFSEGGCPMKSAISFVPGAGKLAENFGCKPTLLPFAKISERALVVLVDRANNEKLDTTDTAALINAFKFKLAVCV